MPGLDMMDMLTMNPSDWFAILKLLIACLLGGALGLEREITKHPAGLRTHILVAMGSAGFVLLSAFVIERMPGMIFDPGRVMQGAITGVGFIGAGTIMKEGASIHGITTAASLWVACAVGLLVGVGALPLALTITIVGVATLTVAKTKHESTR